MSDEAETRPRPFAADLHVHSALSPCAGDDMAPRVILNRLAALGVDIFSITDHNCWFNCAAFDEIARDSDLLFVPGIEVQSTEEIHLLGYFPDLGSLKMFCTTTVEPAVMRGLKNDPEKFGSQLKLDVNGQVLGQEDALLSMPLSLTVDELVRHIHVYDGVAVAAHIDRGFSVVSQLGFIPSDLELDAVEIQDATKVGSISSVYIKDRDLNVISSSDVHHTDMMKKPGMKLWLSRFSVDGVLDCIRGKGDGKVTFRDAGANRAERAAQKAGGAGATGSRKDWKGLYG